MNENILYPSRNSLRKLANKTFAISLFICVSATILQTTYAEDGAALHQENCIACHAAMTGGDGSVLYTRDDHAVKSSGALSKQVDRCQSSLGLAWSKDQIGAVQQYLNSSFYQF
jgi:cytochrome c2